MRQTTTARTLAAVAAWCITQSAFADGTTLGEISQAARRSGDKSREALVTIYGQVVNNPLATGGAGGGDTILASLFQVMNGALLVVGAMFACYVMFRKLTQTAHDGMVYDREKHTLWGPIRLVWGLSALVPTANGWSLAQLLMLWATSVMGIGIANLGTDAAISALQDGKGMVVQPVMPSTNDLAHRVFEADLCMHGINAGLADALAAGALVTQDSYVQQAPTSSGFMLKNASFVCGGADINSNLDPQPKSTNWISATIDASQVRQAHLQALSDMQKALSEAARNFVNAVTTKMHEGGTLPDAEVAIQSAAQQYESTVNKSAGTKQGDIEALAEQMGSTIKESGWWTLGAWYQTFAQANTKLTDAIAAKGATFGPSTNGDPAMISIYQAALDAYKAQRATNTSAPPVGSNGTQESDSNKLLGRLFAPMQRVTTTLTTDVNLGGEQRGQLNPLIKMKNLGDYLMGTAEFSLATYGVITGIANASDGLSAAGIASRVANFFTSAPDVLKGMLKAMSPFLVMAIVALFLLGGTLSTYLPMVPFIIWFGAAVNWLVVVGEAIIAAPLWALAHLGGEGDGMGQRTTHGYIFLLNAIFRPVLMVAGFFLGGAIIVAGGTLLNDLFGVAIANVQYDSMTGIFSTIFFVAIYCSMCLNLVHNSFNLIFIVPDQVINWVGGHASATPGREDNDRLRNAVNVFASKLEHMPGISRNGGKRPAGSTKPSDGNGMKS
ncbi:DotA/TraY family protein [Burkholderia pseudomallei]|uniref:DotA/TraY family protein n=1 Tax=Burkholderia pseudomallei TaxID=28450 RepID=UPI00105FDD1E|nr:DotA/TraY family protein [Burkholderia pseudomallei]MDA0559697.1 DotA/TraY family protein [Burkholderia pseudomallei]